MTFWPPLRSHSIDSIHCILLVAKDKSPVNSRGGAVLPLLPGKHGKVTWYERMWKRSNAATTWKMQSAPLNVIITCFSFPHSHMYTENIQTPPMKPQLCEQDKYPEISLEPSDVATCILTYSWNTLCELFIRESIFSYTLTAIFLSMLTASVHHSYSNEGKNQMPTVLVTDKNGEIHFIF